MSDVDDIRPADPDVAYGNHGGYPAVAAILDDAAALIDRVGLHQGEFWPGRLTAGYDVRPYRDGDPVCAFGAIDVITLGTATLNVPASAAYAAHMTGSIDVWWRTTDGITSADCNVASAWNDAPGRTADEVAASLRDAATAVRAIRGD